MRHTRLHLALAVAVATAIAPSRPMAQTPEPTAQLPEFEVAVIKIHQRGTPTTAGVPTVLPGRLSFLGIGVRLLTAESWDMMGRVDVGPGYPKELDTYQFDIDAKTDLPPANYLETFWKAAPMMRRLLADRFKMVVHREMRDARSFALVQAKGGHKLKPAAEGNNDNHGDTAMLPASGGTFYKAFPVYGLLNILTGSAGAPVLDETGLGHQMFDFTIERVRPGGELLTIFQALEPLGLKLEERKGKVEYLIIDHAEMPTGN